jgi:nucleoside-diphosphate-sugar epimerase
MCTKVVLFTGATGQIGSELVQYLQKMDYLVLCLVRAKNGEDCTARLNKAIGGPIENCVAVSGDLVLAYAGMSEVDRNKWRGKIDMIVHGGASVRFDEKSANETRMTNINGTKNMLALADDLGVKQFHYIGTAYIAGNAEVFREEDVDVGQVASNAYESSKKIAEELVRNWQGKFSVHRLSIVIGDSKTGFVNAFYGYYGFLAPFLRLLQILKSKQDECVSSGIVKNNGCIYLPIAIGCSLDSTLNLVTGDWVAQTLAKLIALPCVNQTYHLVNPNPPKVQWAIETSLRLLGIDGLVYGKKLEFSSGSLLNSLQKVVNRGLKEYLKYVNVEPKFVCDNLRLALKGAYVPPPVIDQALLAIMISYAKSVNFGQKQE